MWIFFDQIPHQCNALVVVSVGNVTLEVYPSFTCWIFLQICTRTAVMCKRTAVMDNARPISHINHKTYTLYIRVSPIADLLISDCWYLFFRQKHKISKTREGSSHSAVKRIKFPILNCLTTYNSIKAKSANTFCWFLSKNCWFCWLPIFFLKVGGNLDIHRLLLLINYNANSKSRWKCRTFFIWHYNVGLGGDGAPAPNSPPR